MAFRAGLEEEEEGGARGARGGRGARRGRGAGPAARPGAEEEEPGRAVERAGLLRAALHEARVEALLQPPQERQPRPPRQPQNLQGLLRFALQANQEAPAEEQPVQPNNMVMDPESRAFMEEALRSLTLDNVKEVQESGKILCDEAVIHAIQSGEELPDEIENAFSRIVDFVGDLDVANDFYKVGGFNVFSVCFSAENEFVRARACDLLAEVSQNNACCQARVLESGLLNVLMNMAENETNSNNLIKTLYAISCAVREYEPSCKEFIAQNGCEILMKLLKRKMESDNRLLKKLLFLTNYFCQHYTEVRKQLAQRNVVPELAAILSKSQMQDKNSLMDLTINILGSIIADRDARAVDQCRDPKLGIKSMVEKILEESLDYEWKEKADTCTDILSVFRVDSPSDANPNDDGVER